MQYLVLSLSVHNHRIRGIGLILLRYFGRIIASAIKYLKSVIPAEAGIQIYSWIPPAKGIPGQAQGNDAGFKLKLPDPCSI